MAAYTIETKEWYHLINDEGGIPIAAVYGRGAEPGGGELARERAVLFAAAPDLLAVVRELAETPWEHIHIKAIQSKAIGLVAKAEGK